MAELYGCCIHCEHDVNEPPHEIPCPDGCGEWDENDDSAL